MKKSELAQLREAEARLVDGFADENAVLSHAPCGRWGAYIAVPAPRYDPRRLGGAVILLDRVLALDPRNARALARRGRAKRVLGDFKGALRDLASALALVPGDAYALAALGDVKRALGRAGGDRDLQRAVGAAPELVWAKLWKASWHINDRKWAAAKQELSAARGLGAGQALESILSGILAVELDDAAAARDHLGRATALDPGCPGAWTLRGRAELMLGREDDAFASYEQVMRLDPDAKHSYLYFLGIGEPSHDAKGLAELDTAVARVPRMAWAWALRGELQRMPQLARYDEAVSDLERAAELAPACAWIRAFLSRAYAGVGRGKEAADEMRRALALDPECAWLHAWHGESLRKAGRLAEAEPELTRAITLDKRCMVAWAWRGMLYNEQGRYDRALPDLDRAIDLDPWYHLAYAERARALLSLSDAPGAVADMTFAAKLNPKFGWIAEGAGGRRPAQADAILATLAEASKLHPKNAWLYAWRGEALLRLADYEGAIALLDRALKLDDGLAWAYAWRGEACARGGKPDRALPDLERAISLDPGYSRSWGWKGAALFQLQRFKKAVAALDKAISLDARSAWEYCWRGKAKCELGDFSGAVADFDHALILEHRYGEAYFRRALAHEKLGHALESLQDSARALRLSPGLFDDTAGARLRAQLRR